MESDRIGGTIEDKKANVTAGRDSSSLRRECGAGKPAVAGCGAIAIALRLIWLGLLIGIPGHACAMDWTSPLGELKQAAKQKAVDSADAWLNRALELQREDAQTERAMGPEAQQQAQAARAAFEACQERGAEPVEVYNPYHFTTAKRQIEHYRRAAESIKGRTVLTPEEVRELGDALLPFLRYIYRSPDGTTGIDGTVVDLAPGQKAPTETERLLGQLTRLPVEGAAREGSEYSMPVPGVAVKAVSIASLSPIRLEFINTTSSCVSFDTSEFVGQSVRVTQRVALGGVSDGGAGVAQRLVEVLRLLQLEPLKNLQALLQRTLDAYGNRADATNLDRAAVEVATLLNEFLFPVSVLDIVPMASQAGRLCKGAARLNALERGTGALAKEAGKAAENVSLASASRTKHILTGDRTGGGHLFPGMPGKTPFPENWPGERIMHEISDVATDPNAVRLPGRGGRTIVRETRDGVGIEVILEAPENGGGIVTGYPINLPKNQ